MPERPVVGGEIKPWELPDADQRQRIVDAAGEFCAALEIAGFYPVLTGAGGGDAR